MFFPLTVLSQSSTCSSNLLKMAPSPRTNNISLTMRRRSRELTTSLRDSWPSILEDICRRIDTVSDSSIRSMQGSSLTAASDRARDIPTSTAINLAEITNPFV